jgi:hypothetical protein
MGGAFGTAVLGAVLTARVSVHLKDLMPAEAASQIPAGALSNVQAIQQLPPVMKDPVLLAFTEALQDVFHVALPFVVAALLISFLIPEIPLRTRQVGESEALGEPAPMFLE